MKCGSETEIIRGKYICMGSAQCPQEMDGFDIVLACVDPVYFV